MVDAVNNVGVGLVPDGRDTKLRELASEFVNQIFFGTLLREFREGQDNAIFGNGPGGTTFVNQLDNVLIERMSKRGGGPLVDAVMKQISKNGFLKSLEEKNVAYKDNIRDLYVRER